MLRNSTLMELSRGRRLYRPGGPIQAVYFPVLGVVSIVVGAGEGAEVEMATVGNEGMVGVAVLLGVPRSIGKAFVQVPGAAISVSAASLVDAVTRDRKLLALLQRYFYALMHQVMQAGACNRLHSSEERCARWLLMTHDRAGADEFPLTQDFLAEMMGTRRAAVNIALATFRRAGAIDYVYRHIKIMDRKLLESFSCPCYELIRRTHRAVTV